MELLELKQKVLEIFEVNDLSALGEALMNAVLCGDKEKFERFVVSMPGLDKDWLQKIFQYYQADRRDKKQDFTPYSLASFMARITDVGSDTIIDMCAGSGALTIQAWNLNKNRLFILYELDEKIIPYLLFNLAVRNINAVVYHGNVLERKIFYVYNISHGQQYSDVKREEYGEHQLNQQSAVQCQMGSSFISGRGQLSLLAV